MKKISNEKSKNEIKNTRHSNEQDRNNFVGYGSICVMHTFPFFFGKMKENLS